MSSFIGLTPPAGELYRLSWMNDNSSWRTTMANAEKTPIALITGGSRGLGRSMALHLAERGVDVIFTYRAAASEASEVREQIRARGRKVVALPLDVTDSASFDAFGRDVA